MKMYLYFVAFLLFSLACTQKVRRLPILGTPEITLNDTIYPTISYFEFINQDSQIVTSNGFKNKIYIADFIFLSCPTICPKMTSELKSVYETFKNNDEIMFISHTIDPLNDSVFELKEYANNLAIDHKKWLFVTGNKDSIYNLAEQGYFSKAYQDQTAPGGYVHSGGFLLVDKKKQIRGVYDGTNHLETKRLISDIKTLLLE
jgi:protein SCO1/2